MLVASQAAYGLPNLTDRLAQSALARLRRGLRWRRLLRRRLLRRLGWRRLLGLGWSCLRGRLLRLTGLRRGCRLLRLVRLICLIRWHRLCILGILITLREILVRHVLLLHKSDWV